MSLLLEIALAATGLSLAAALACGLVTSWRRVMHDDAPLPLFGMLKQRRLSAKGLEGAADAGILALAVRRCACCATKEECRAWLASGRRDGHPAHCPNAGLFEQGTGR